jgi:hypothetical protein
VKTKIVIMNDRVIPMILKVQDVTCPSNMSNIGLQPAEVRVIEYEIPNDCVPYFKIWENNVALLSYFHKDTVLQTF